MAVLDETPRTKTQRQLIKEHLLQGNAITPMDALHRFGSFRLAAIIFLLRYEDHMDIHTIDTAQGNKRFAKYVLAEFNQNEEFGKNSYVQT